MSDDTPVGSYTLSEIVEAVEILQRANMVLEAVKTCDAAGFRMQFADIKDGLTIAEVLQKAIAHVQTTDPNYYKQDATSDQHILVGGPCPCRR
jgi:hypothetical protein